MEVNYMFELESYAKYMFNRNLRVFSQNIFTPIDFVYEAIVIGFDSIEAAKKIIVDLILKEKRRLIAKIQQSENRSHFDVRDKKCCKCGLHKPISEFAPRMDYRTGFRYYNSYCSVCSAKISREKRQKHVITDHDRKLNRERQRRYAKNKKLLKAA